MMLLAPPDERTPNQNLGLGGSTAFVAGLVNVVSVVAFFAFSSNVTGHVAIFAEESVKGHWHQVTVVLLWMGMFLVGALLASVLVLILGAKWPRWGAAAPLLLEVVLLLAVGHYGHHHYAESLRETEVLVAALLFAMGVQNGMVASVTNAVVKTTHLTGLFTDLGNELARYLRKDDRRDATLRFKLRLRLVILGGYVIGGVSGALLFARIGFSTLLVGGAVLLSILVHDLVTLAFRGKLELSLARNVAVRGSDERPREP